jgi:DnaJ-class molecular chaperone
MAQTTSNSETCGTCQGEGVTGSEAGPLTCLDCAGTGKLPSGLVRTEWRLRELERIHAAASGEAGQDIQWLIHQVRRSHHALLQILAASADLDEAHPTLRRIKFLANDVLDVYSPVK